ncbi:MAG: peptide chain release factor N(5)-glutamine methyltransferase [Pseudomonadota bacterium]
MRAIHTESLDTRLKWAREQLDAVHIESGALDARLLLKHVLKCGDEFVLAHPEYALSPEQKDNFAAVVDRRSQHEPVSKIIGEREFWGLPFYVTQDTLDPRPDSETLVETVLSFVKDRAAPLQILDLGTGTGCLLLALLKELKQAQGVGVDCCPRALKVAMSNAKRLQMDARVQFVQGNWGQDLEGPFDVIVSNPPYIAADEIGQLSKAVKDYDPLLALQGGRDGLACYREIMSYVRALLAPEGLVAFEIGKGQKQEVENIMIQTGLTMIQSTTDLAGIPRCLLAKVNKNNQET